MSANSVRCLPLSLIAPKMEREWSVDGARIGYFLHKVRTLTLHNSNAIMRRLLMENTRAYTPAKTAEQTTLTHLRSTQRVAESGRLHLQFCSILMRPLLDAGCVQPVYRLKSGRCWVTRTATSRHTTQRLSWKNFLKRQIGYAEKSSAKLRHWWY